MSQTVSETLASFVHRLRFEEIPVEVVQKAKTCLIHGIGVGLAGYDTDFPRIAAEIAGVNGRGAHEATLLYNGSKCTVMEAAFANAVMLHSRVQEDTHNTAHLGTIVIPVVLALGESRGASGKEILTALIAGYEVGGALSRHYTSQSTPRGFRASSVYGILGASAAAAKLLHLTEEQTAHALGFAASFAFGTLEAFAAGTMEWRFENGLAAKNGILCALLAQSGAVATKLAFEGNAGFLHAFAGNHKDPLKCVQHLGSRYEILNVTFKLYPVCAFNQSPVINALEMKKEFDIQVEQIQSIVIEMNDYEANYPGMSSKGPFQNISQTLMSAPFCVSSSLMDGEMTLANLKRFEHETLNQLIGKTTIIPEKNMNPLCNKISVELKNGQKLVREMNITQDYYNLETERDIEIIRDLRNEMQISSEQLEQLIHELLSLENKPNLSALIPNTTAAG
ncbi:MmgE/PrpD family protein [Paenibacillus naphthalenovorans]|uniref:MmgE/PrpD family protein n=1 Tax=Paenibacillus naphthalenovorans TaxID=162209 RepID=UPI00088763BD|nr:MmgE/PrpD family protein [Paenibacillus naphthalenovorans]SDI40440.1 2-methylcitrate dehydratase PrpD [Paenibacillus naphthalenovorans]